jgi:hypothetical protein
VLTPVTNDAYCPSVEPYTLQDSSGSITSQPGGYKPNSACVWEVIYQASPYLTITADVLDTEASYDWVDVYDAFGLVGALSGNKTTNKSFTTDSGGCAGGAGCAADAGDAVCACRAQLLNCCQV